MPNFQKQNTFHFMFDRMKEPLTIQPYLGKSDDPLGLGDQEYGTPVKVVEPITTTSNPAITYQQGSGGEMEVSILVWSSRTAGYRKGTLVTRDNTGETYTVTSSAPLTHSRLTYYTLQRNGGDENEPNGDGSTGGSADKVSNEAGEKIPWVYEKAADEKRQLPFFSWHISVPHQRILWKQVNGEFYTKTIQVKIHAADPLEANDRIEWMQNVLNSMQPQIDLAQKGISVISVSDPEPLDEDWTISIENQVGTNVRLMVNSNYHDNTQSGEIAAVEPNYTIKKEES